jgi:hypothetical protein
MYVVTNEAKLHSKTNQLLVPEAPLQLPLFRLEITEFAMGEHTST